MADYLDLTADVVSAYVANNSVPAAGLADLIGSVYAALSQAAVPTPVAETPALKARRTKTVYPDRIISLEDGKPYVSLKRHLAGRGLTPEAYRAKWNLPANYPMVAVEYSERRSALAKALGLGRKQAAKAPAKKAALGRGKAKK